MLSFFQDLLGQMVPQDADLGKWPLTHLELNIYLTYLNVLAIEGQYGKIIPIARKLLANIEQGYHNPWIFVDYHGCFTHKLIRSLHKEGQCDEIRELAEKSIDICTSFGNISNTYLLQSELLWYYEEYDFFNDPNLKEQCFETAKKMYYLSLMCEDKNNYSYFKAYLGRVYGYMELLY